MIDKVYLATEDQVSGITRRQADTIIRELRQIRNLLASQAARPAPAEMPVAPKPEQLSVVVGADSNSLGNKSAGIVVVEYTDYQCPYCAAFHAQTFPALKKAYIDTGKIRFVSVDLPLSMHPYALRAAEAARCAQDQGKFWEMRDWLISHAADLGQNTVLLGARSLSLDLGHFNRCLAANTHEIDVQRDVKYAESLGVVGTPTFIVGRISRGRVTGTVVSGARPLSDFQQLIAEVDARRH